MLKVQRTNYQDVTAIITAMTDDEQRFLVETVSAVIADSSIGQIILCVDEKNAWVEKTLSPFAEDLRLVLLRLPMATVGAVRNRALDSVELPWVAYCDGDDTWCKGKTHAQRSWADFTESDFVGADHYLTDERGKVCSFAFARYIPMPSSWLVRTAIMKQYPFDESLSSASDGEWWIRTNNIIRKARYPKMLLKYRVRSGSLSSNTLSKQRKARTIAFARVPVLREIVLFVTCCLWLITRREEYIWLEDWGQKHASWLLTANRSPLPSHPRFSLR
jgi:hypothetical protein